MEEAGFEQSWAQKWNTNNIMQAQLNKNGIEVGEMRGSLFRTQRGEFWDASIASSWR